MSGRSAKQKGAQAEREAAGVLSDLLGIAVKRELGQTREGGADLRVGDCVVEVKRQERASVHVWLSQAEAAAENGELAAVMWRPSRRGWVVCMTVEDWATLMREALVDADMKTALYPGNERIDLGRGSEHLGRGVVPLGSASGSDLANCHGGMASCVSGGEMVKSGSED